MRTSESPRAASGRFASGKRSRPSLSVLKNPFIEVTPIWLTNDDDQRQDDMDHSAMPGMKTD